MSLGYHNNGPRRSPRQSPRQSLSAPSSPSSSTLPDPRGAKKRRHRILIGEKGQVKDILHCGCGGSYPTLLCLLNLALFVAHAGIAIYVSTVDFKFPVTVFRTQLNESVIDDFQCIFDYSKNEEGVAFCPDKKYTKTGNAIPPSSCNATLSSYDSSYTLPALSESGGPLTRAFELSRFTLGPLAEADKEGRAASKWILFTIEMLTAVFHLLYVFLFSRIVKDATKLTPLLEYGGLPARWLEYSITASLMTFFISNIANVFEFSSLLAICLSTFAVMYFGETSERLLFQGYTESSLKMLLIPGTALFLVPWVPSLQQILNDVLKISCSNWQEGGGWMKCAQTCFGRSLPIPLFAGILILLFAVFPLILLWKVYYVSYMQRWTRLPKRVVTSVCLVAECSFMRIPADLLLALIHPLLFLLFIPYAGWVALVRLLLDTSVPFLPKESKQQTIEEDDKRKAFYIGEMLYALASATSKIFLAVYFLVAFSQRSW